MFTVGQDPLVVIVKPGTAANSSSKKALTAGLPRTPDSDEVIIDIVVLQPREGVEVAALNGVENLCSDLSR